LIKIDPNSHFLCLTGDRGKLVEELMTQRRIKPEQFSVHSVKPAEVPAYLCASDAAIAFYEPAFSRLATSPVKLAEYLACGLPVIINAGVGDSDDFVADQKLGAVVKDFNEAEYRKALVAIRDLASEETRNRARHAAELFFDVRRVGVERYARLYEKVLTGTVG